MVTQLLFNSWNHAILLIGDVDSQLPYRSALHDLKIGSRQLFFLILLIIVLFILLMAFLLKDRVRDVSRFLLRDKETKLGRYSKKYVNHLNAGQIRRIIKYKKSQQSGQKLLLLFIVGLVMLPFATVAQQVDKQITADSMWGRGGIIITIILLAIPVLFAIILLFIKIRRKLTKLDILARQNEAKRIAGILTQTKLEEMEADLLVRQQAEEYRLEPNQLSGTELARDDKGIINVNEELEIAIVSRKKKASYRPNIAPQLSNLVIWFLGTATFWLLFGTTVGEYLGIKFVSPDMEQISWLSFGRLRPVHTNAVFWGWASLAMIGLAYYVVPRVSNTKLYSIRWGWSSLVLINLSVMSGSVTLMAGINNGGGEYREYIWPVMLPFAAALILTLINFYQTIGSRATREVYISNWYIVSAIIFTIVIVLVAYLPFWQHGLGETIVQGYYMHQGVGMWFMLFTLGLVYYYLPQQLNKPIYSYSLGILAFWTQILFYTLIGSHHFVFSSIPWWLQTVAIVGSAGMAIPVFAGTTNFLMTFKGAWYKVGESYTLPFFLVGIIFYFTGSMQGTAEAFRETNLIWHFTDFTVAHSHLTMYGIICFFLWACIYTIMPRFTGNEPPQLTVGAHFWLALLGLMFYTIPLMYGSTLKGIMWMDGKPFIDGIVFMAPYWLWRAIGGSLMWISHLFFAYNMYKMIAVRDEFDIGEEIVRQLEDNKTKS
ncbi:cbb3-type cytochrome c oxidase subunit I [Sphingobacterium siyangense]|uniref:cbb3-type cytochrome c oxidase subunit I n=1 Tax=Sphingobacterium siyangense TaxID=459529 RepID=UPI003C71761F